MAPLGSPRRTWKPGAVIFSAARCFSLMFEPCREIAAVLFGCSLKLCGTGIDRGSTSRPTGLCGRPFLGLGREGGGLDQDELPSPMYRPGLTLVQLVKKSFARGLASASSCTFCLFGRAGDAKPAVLLF